MHIERHRFRGWNDIVGQFGQRRLACVRGCGQPPVQRQVAEEQLRLLDRIGVVMGEVVAAARDGGVHPRATHLFESHLLADHHLGHPGRAEVHRCVGLDHDHDVGERRDVGAAGSGRSEQAADLRHLP